MVETPDSEKVLKRSPKYLTGTAGNQAMHLWEKIYAAEGEQGIARADKELDVFVWSVKGKQLWKFLVRTPDMLIDKERKIEVIREHLQNMGASKVFIDLMAEMFRQDNLSLLEQVAEDFHAINREHRREVDVSLFTPSELDQATLDYYKATIALNYLKEGDNLIFTHHVDNNIGSGYRVVVKDKIYDFTRDTPRKQLLQQLELAEGQKISEIEKRVKPTFTPELTPALLKDLDLPSWGLDENFGSRLEEEAARRKKAYEQARVQLVEKLSGKHLQVAFE